MNTSQERWQPVPVRLPDGREWPSISACARAIGLHISTVQKAIDRGTLSGLGRGSGISRKSLRCGDREFSSISAAAAWIGCSVSPLSERRLQAVKEGRDSFIFRGRTFQIPSDAVVGRDPESSAARGVTRNPRTLCTSASQSVVS